MALPQPGRVAAGDYRHSVTYRTPALAPRNAPGELPAEPWTAVVTLRAAVECTGGSETTIAGQPSALSTFVVRHRYYPALAQTGSYLWLGLTLNIVSMPSWDPKKIEMTVTCVQRDNLT